MEAVFLQQTDAQVWIVPCSSRRFPGTWSTAQPRRTSTRTLPAGAASVRARVSLLGGIANPARGGQAFVVDEFTLTVEAAPIVAIPTLDPRALALLALLLAAAATRVLRAS